MDRELIPIRFIDQPITVDFDLPPVRKKTPPCPDGFVWEGKPYRVVERLEEWSNFARRGRFARNMTPGHAASASRRGSWGVGRFFFRVRTESGQFFELYYDRAPKDASDRMGAWFLYRELRPNLEG